MLNLLTSRNVIRGGWEGVLHPSGPFSHPFFPGQDTRSLPTFADKGSPYAKGHKRANLWSEFQNSLSMAPNNGNHRQSARHRVICSVIKHKHDDLEFHTEINYKVSAVQILGIYRLSGRGGRTNEWIRLMLSRSFKAMFLLLLNLFITNARTKRVL